jgi:multiple sugar transport system ATP-binding protein
MAQVVLKHLWKRYGDVVAVKDVSLTIQDREFLVLVGPSGCGKSTTLRMVAGLEEISEGDLFIGDRRVNDVAPKDRDIAMVFQSYALYPHWTVFDNMAFALRLRKVPSAEIRRRVEEAAMVLEIDHLLHRKPKALSGGQRQRVAMGRAIVRDPAVFLFDEPLSNLDAKLRVQMRVEISRLHNALKTTILYVTHDQVEAMTLADRIVIMDQGEIQQVGSPSEVYQRPVNLFVATFMGSPAMNILPAIVEGNRLRIAETALTLPESHVHCLKGYSGPVRLGVRPQHVSLAAPEQKEAVLAKVEVEEYLGAEKFVYLKLDGTPMTARLGAQDVTEEGRESRFLLDLRQSHLFDDSGRNMTLAATEGSR